ncbi:hypothetical protein [Bacillus thuringiensis]|nr:hypothetical protein [Bacillus thuringiensis]
MNDEIFEKTGEVASLIGAGIEMGICHLLMIWVECRTYYWCGD